MKTIPLQNSAVRKDATIALGIVLLAASTLAIAGSDNTFAAAAQWLDSNLTGSMGKTFALGSLAVGLGAGIVKQSVMAVAIGAGVAMVASLGPGILNGMFSAVL
jgi:conjugal transfer pilus assembly protein TraA